MPFDSETWKAAAEVGGDLRIRFLMLEDLFSRHDLVGMHASEIEALLGPLVWGQQDIFGSSYTFGLNSPPWCTPTFCLFLDFDAMERVASVRFDIDPFLDE